MITKFSWRRAVAVPAVLTLALGGALLSTTAANAADGMLVITSPTEGSTTTSRDVTVSGTAAPGAVINVFTDSTRSERLAQTTTDGTTGAFSAALPTYADTEPVAQSIFVDGLVGLSGFDNPQTRAFNLPAVVAPVETFSVTTPKLDEQLASRTVTYSGTGNSGSTVNVLDIDGNRLPGTDAVTVVNGQWSLEYTYPETADRNQIARVTQVTGGAGTGEFIAAFVLPQGQTLVVATPAEGATTASRTVVFSGTGTVGSTVNVLDTEDNQLAPVAVVDDDGAWSATVVYADDAAVAQSARVTQITGGAGSGDISRTFALPAVVVPPTDVTLNDPVITSPAQGQVVVGDQVTFEGTGTPGSNILLAVIPTDQLDELEAVQGDDTVAAAAEPVDPADPIVVDDEGNWTVTLALTPNDYTAAAVSFLLDETGAPVLSAAGQPIISDPSADVAFSLVAAVIPAGTPATPITAPVATPSGLAYTGSEGTEAGIGIGAAVLLLGTTLMVLARRRTKLAPTDAASE